MLEFNFLVILLAALIPMVLGFIWYNPKVFGNAWMAAADMNEEKMKGANMAVIFIISFILSVLLAFSMVGITIHQFGVQSLFMADPEFITEGSAVQTQFSDLMTQFDGAFRTFKHGALHGTIAGLFFALPVLGTNALFERKGWKYILVNCGYWTVCLALMGGVICQWL